VRTRWIIAGTLAAVGAVWVGQGAGLLRGSSFMVNDVRWAVAGTVLIAAAAIVVVSAVRGRRRL
jgi:hypothetical protein